MEKGKIRTGKDPSQSRVVVLPGLSPFLGVRGKSASVCGLGLNSQTQATD